MEYLYWALPTLLVSSVVIGWAAETSQLFISQGLALAVLAWLQVLPEFAVEAVVAWEQKQSLMVANLTGSLRLLVGLGWPLIFLTYCCARKTTKAIKFPVQNATEVFLLLISTLYFGFIALKGSLTVGDAFILIFFYFVYLRLVAKMAKVGTEVSTHALPWVGRKIASLHSPLLKMAWVFFLFAFGGLALNYSAGPFLHGLEKWSLSIGISTFVFIQWLAPFVSEFPEKITALNWARQTNKAPMAVMNLVSSNIVQWTVMAGMIPIIFSISKHGVTPIFLDAFQTREILLTIMQSLLSIFLLMDLELSFLDSLLLFTLWLIQFVWPLIRLQMVYVYLFFISIEIILLIKNKKLFFALQKLREQVKKQ